MVRNEEKKAFRDMEAEDRIKIFNALIDGNAEYWSSDAWCKHGTDAIFMHSIYRTKPRQLVIPWEVIKPEYKWAAMDEDGSVAIFDGKPIADCDSWLCGNNGRGKSLELHAINIDTTGIDWRESLTQRPEGCDEKQY